MKSSNFLKLLFVIPFMTMICGIGFAQIQTAQHYNVTAGSGNGLRFWGHNNYKIHMGNLSEHRYGPVTSYSIKSNMSNHAQRGWTWGVAGQTPVTALNTQGNFQTKGWIRSEASVYFFGTSTNSNALGAFNGALNWVGTDMRSEIIISGGQNIYGTFKGGRTNDQFFVGITDKNNRYVLQSFNDEFLYLGVGNGEKMRIQANGNVGIYTSNPSYRLDVNGTVRANGFSQSSDKRFKKGIKKIDDAMDKINALDGLTYTFKEGKIGNHDFSTIQGQKQLGFMAQDMKEVFPELVSEDQDGYLSVNYIGLIPVLVEGMKEQEEIITEQKEEIADLQSRMERLEALLDASSEDIRGNLPISTEDTNTGIVLRQNAPNPLSDHTTIEYQLPDEVKAASLIVSDFNGRVVATYAISGQGTVEFSAKGLDNGTYVYAIIANGKSIAGQKMVVQK